MSFITNIAFLLNKVSIGSLCKRKKIIFFPARKNNQAFLSFVINLLVYYFKPPKMKCYWTGDIFSNKCDILYFSADFYLSDLPNGYMSN
jgi:hypothetical protein